MTTPQPAALQSQPADVSDAAVDLLGNELARKHAVYLTRESVRDLLARAILALRPAQQADGMPSSPDERHLRRLLAHRVAIPLTYYDDGEAHGSEHGIQIDFMREPVADIAAKLKALDVAKRLSQSPAHQATPEPVALTDERIDHIADLVVRGMPEGVMGFLNSWGWRQFARALLEDCAGHYALPPATPEPVGEVVAWLSTDCIGESYVCFTKPQDSDTVRPLVFGDTHPAPAPQQVPMTDGVFDLICSAIDKADSITMEGDYMLDSDDCIAVVRVMQALLSIHHGITAQGAQGGEG